jgi:uncharacterized protein YlzI (FlbEa/FlbD family)
MELMNIGGERYINARHIVSVRIGWRGTIVTMVNGERFWVEEKARDFAILLMRHDSVKANDGHRDV